MQHFLHPFLWPQPLPNLVCCPDVEVIGLSSLNQSFIKILMTRSQILRGQKKKKNHLWSAIFCAVCISLHLKKNHLDASWKQVLHLTCISVFPLLFFGGGGGRTRHSLTQPPTVACKSGSSVGTRARCKHGCWFFFARASPRRLACSVGSLSTKISGVGAQVGSLLRVRCWSGRQWRQIKPPSLPNCWRMPSWNKNVPSPSSFVIKWRGAGLPRLGGGLAFFFLFFLGDIPVAER